MRIRDCYRIAAAVSVMMFFAIPGFGQSFTSDDFDLHNLNTGVWTFTDPVGDVTLALTGTGTSDARVALTLPAGVQHDLWTGVNTAPRILQNATNTNFVLEAKFDSKITSTYQIQGVLVQESDNALMRVDLSSEGSNINLTAANTTDGFASAPTVLLAADVGDTGTAPIWLQVTRTGGTWVIRTSTNGTTFDSIGTFNLAMTVSKVGLWAGNAGPLPAFTMLADYFFDTSDPVEPEDGGATTDVLPPLVYNVSSIAGSSVIQVSWKTDERSTSVLEYGLTAAYGSSVIDNTLRTDHTLQITSLTAETPYHFRIVADDSLDQTTTTGDFLDTTTAVTKPTVVLWHGSNQSFGSIGTAQRWVNILGNVSHPVGIDSLYYELNGGPSVMLSQGPDLRRLQNTGDFNIDIGFDQLSAGANTVHLRARSLFGDVIDTLITVNDNSGAAWPLPYSVAWSTATGLKDSAQVVDGKWEVSSGVARPAEWGYDRAISIGDTTWQDYEVTMKLNVHSINTSSEVFELPSAGPAVGILMRWKGHTDNPIGGQPLPGYLPLGAVGWIHWTDASTTQWELLGNNLTEEVTSATPAFSFNTEYYFKMQVKTYPGVGGYYRFKAWKTSESEPSTWLLNAQESLTDPQFGSMLILAHHVEVDIDDVQIIATPADVIPPVISGIASEPGPTSAYITWTTDEPATRRVAYGLTTSYGDTAEVGGELSLTHGVPITGLNPSATYHYMILSADNDGNLGTSADGTFTTEAPAAATTLVSDEFNAGSLSGFWSPFDPKGDGTFATAGAVLELGVPAGTAHDLWTNGNDVVRVMQNANDTDFEVEVKWNSFVFGSLTEYRIQGILVEQDADDLIRFDFTSSPAGPHIFAAAFNNGFVRDSIRVKVDSTIVEATGIAPVWLRVKREGNVWTQSYSIDGTTWKIGAVFHHAMTVAKVGLFVGNAGSAPPVFAGTIDYFRTDGVVVNL
ncbi:MAG: hypothetical protein IT282_13935, partial [Bacteroidetes bacterium]|nr:hypothetical protein [Bacteroidota bacterium]